MVTQEKPSYPTGYIMLDHVVEAVKEAHEAPWHAKEAFGPNEPFCGHLWLAWLLMVWWSLETLGEVLVDMLKPFEPWRCPYVEPLMYGDEELVDEEPLMKTLMPLQRSLLVWWHAEGTHTHVMTFGHTYLHLVMIIDDPWWCSWNACDLRTHTHDDGILDDDVVGTHTWHTYIDPKVKCTLHTLD